MDTDAVTNETLDRVIETLQSVRGIDLNGYRRATLGRRFALRLARSGISDIEDYLAELASNPAECDALISTIDIPVSRFFRDPEVFDVLARKGIPDTLDRLRSSGDTMVRCWSAGCSQGEEAYSLAILLYDAIEEEGVEWRAIVFGTDTDPKAINRAKTADFPREKYVDVRLGVLDRHFVQQGGGERFTVRDHIRDMVHFSPDDLNAMDHAAPAESVYGDFDIILCRNVLIYFSPERQRAIVSRLRRALAPGGLLVLGRSERVHPDLEAGFSAFDTASRVWKRRMEDPWAS
ncbi:MAG: protein-glutamate O-methyltransferase CheR [Deltaproteobacteria bacterium]|nr:protein-glutamate O-methyltransferase CheR [Deltaproteobacteria bacterium]